VFHLKFGDGNVLTIAFDKAGEKRAADRFVERMSWSQNFWDLTISAVSFMASRVRIAAK
jgi:hypothetical protein